MPSALNFTKPKRLLKRRCKTLDSNLVSATKILIKGAQSAVVESIVNASVLQDQLTSASEEISVSFPKVSIDMSHREGLRMFYSYTHGCLIREWHLFLNNVFEELVNYYLRNNMNRKLGRDLKISLKEANFSTLPKLRDSISEALIESFAFCEYQSRIRKVKDIITLSDNSNTTQFEQLLSTLKKHVVVRNCLEHADSKVRKRDLNAIGTRQIEMIKEDGNTHSFAEGDTIFVTDKDVKELKDSILKCINYFEVDLS